MDYTTLTGSVSTNGSIAFWGNSGTLQNEAPDIVQEAESWIYRRLRHWKMLKQATGNIASNSATVSVPSDFLQDRLFYITGVNYAKLTRKTAEEVVASYGYDGSGNRIQQQPLIYFNDQSNFCFDSPADQTYPYLLIYYQQLLPLSVSITNFLTDTYPRMMRCACMAQACEVMKDLGQGNFDRNYWDNLAENEIFKANQESDQAQRSVEAGFIQI